MGNFLVSYTSRVVIYDRRTVIRLATGLYSIKLYSSINDKFTNMVNDNGDNSLKKISEMTLLKINNLILNCL